MKKLILFASIIIAFTSLSAQDGITLHFMRLNPYSTYTSPSAHLQYKGYIGIPGISNINVGFINTGLKYNSIFETNANGEITTINLKNVANNLSPKNNILGTNISLNIIDFGFKTEPIRFSFSYRIRFDGYAFYSKDLFALPAFGNMSYVGSNNPAKLDFQLNMTSYQEFALGMQFEINDRFYIGIRPKLLFGMAHVKSKQINANLYTDPEDYTLRLNYNIDADMACAIPYTITLDSNGMDFNIQYNDFQKILQNAFRNVGASIDLGFTCRINNSFGVSASVLDLGFIHWKTNCEHISGSIAPSGTNTHYDNGDFIFNGLTDDEINQISDDPSAFTDMLLDYFPVTIEQQMGYTKALTSRFLVEGYYNLGKYHRFSALFHGRIINKQFLPSFTIAWNGNFLDIFDLCVSYTVSKKSYGNLGLGIGFNLKVFHLYMATDNIISLFNKKSIQRSLLNAPNANLQFGMVFDWGKLYENKLDNSFKIKSSKEKSSKDNKSKDKPSKKKTTSEEINTENK